MKTKIFEMLNEQMNQELFAACQYQNMASEAAKQNMNGFSKWLYVQSKEELEHFSKFYKFLISINQKPVIHKMKNPEVKSKSVLKFPEEALILEEVVTKLIWKIAKVAQELNEFEALEFIQVFVKEQMEEVELLNDLISKFKLAENGGLYMLDQDLSKRVLK